jgi:hypothetical protein
MINESISGKKNKKYFKIFLFPKFPGTFFEILKKSFDETDSYMKILLVMQKLYREHGHFSFKKGFSDS